MFPIRDRNPTRRTPAVTLAAHAVYGAIVGALYRV